MATTRRTGRIHEVYRDFLGGVNDFVSPLIVADNEFPFARNVEIREPGKVTKSLGFSQLGSTGSAGAIKGMAVFAESDGTRTLLKSHLTTLYKWTGAAWSSIGAIFSNNSTDKVFGVNAYIDGEDRIYFASGLNDNIQYYNGTTTGSISGFKAKFVELYQNKLYFGFVNDGTEYPNRVQYFDEGEDVVVDANFFDDMGEPITGLKEYGGNLYVFSDNGIAQYDGYSFLRIPGNFGTQAARSIAVVESRLMWYNKEGVYLFTGGGLPTLVSRQVQGWIDAVATPSAVSARVDSFGRYALWIGDVTYNGTAYSDVELVYDPLINAWTVTTDRPFITAALYRDEGDFISYAGDTDNDKVWTAEDTVTLGDSTAVNAEYYTAKLDVGKPEDLKNFYEVDVTFKPQGTATYLTVQYRLDGTAAWSNIGGTTNNVDLSGSDDIQTTTLYLPPNVQGKLLQLRVANSATTGGFEVYEVRLTYDVLKS